MSLGPTAARDLTRNCISGIVEARVEEETNIKMGRVYSRFVRYIGGGCSSRFSPETSPVDAWLVHRVWQIEEEASIVVSTITERKEHGGRL